MEFHLFFDETADGGPIPIRHTCDGDDRSPPLRWSDPPQDTRSLVLLVTDPDAPRGTFTHWVLFDLPPDLRNLPEGQKGIGTEGQNDFGNRGWNGPCPPPGHGEHRYVFRLFAVDVEQLPLEADATPEQLERALEGHVLDEARWTGHYGR